MRAKVDHSQGVRSVTNGSYREADRSRRFDSAGSNSWNECLVIKLRHNDHCHMQCERKYLHQPNGPKIDTAGYRFISWSVAALRPLSSALLQSLLQSLLQ